MLRYVINKIFSNKWMAIGLLIGNILLISIAACSPMYSDAVLQRMLTKNLADQMETSGRYPSCTEFRGYYVDFGQDKVPYENMQELESLAEDFAKECPAPIVSKSTELYKTNVSVMEGKVEVSKGTVTIHGTKNMRLDSVTDFENHVTMLSGSLPEAQLKDRTLQAVVSSKTLTSSNLYVGETLTLDKMLDENGDPYYLEIVGVFEAKDQTDPFWFMNPNTTTDSLFVNYDAFRAAFVDASKRQSFSETIYVTPDYTKLRGADADRLLELCSRYSEEAGKLYKNGFVARFEDTLKTYRSDAARLNTTLIVLQIPIFLLLAAFIFMVAGQMLSMDQNEISILKSRGASRRQILSLYLLQSTIFGAVALVISLPLSYLICQVVGSANAFLEFVSRKALPARFFPSVGLYALLACLISILAMVIPAVRYAKVGIVDFKRSKNRRSRPLWQKMFLDVVLIAVSLYGLYSYHQQAGWVAAQIEKGASLDPLLYLCSSMFMLGLAMLFVRLYPWIIKLIFIVGKRFWSPGLYASFLRILRTKGTQNFIMIFLILTMSLGIFSAETARSINSNAEEKICYENGADLILKEKWSSRQYARSDGSVENIFVEPDFAKYEKLSGAESMTKVYVNEKTKILVEEGTVANAVLMGIQTKQFGETAYFKDGLLDDHWYNYLNAMSQDPESVLVSTDFRDKLGVRLGDRISYQANGNSLIYGTVVGFVDYWPSLTSPEAAEAAMNNIQSTLGDSGIQQAKAQNSNLGSSYFVVANLSKIQSAWGTQPYEIWIKNASDSSQYVYDFATENDLNFVRFKDTNADLIALKNDPVFQATNGILTVGFMVVLVLCSVGFLIYWILSIRSRQLQFGIFRAMGMSMREIVSMLINEQIFLSLASILVGTLVGKLTGELYVPLIQTAYGGTDKTIPLTVMSAADDERKLMLVVGVVMIVCMTILWRIIKSIKIAQALKLGED